MSKIADLKRQIATLSDRELAQFRKWFAEFDADAWDRQLETDLYCGRLLALADEALQDHAAGRTTKV